MSLYITRAQPNPPGRDTTRHGMALNSTLNEEWIEFRAEADRNLVGDQLLHRTFTSGCSPLGTELLHRFPSLQVQRGQAVRVHTGRGLDGWADGVLHIYLNRTWFVWNNACGDRGTLVFSDATIDSAQYGPKPPEGILIRISGTDRLEPAMGRSYSWL